ncbi:MAG: hypothetical protein QWI36_04565 [Wolbachia endosymbiont of Tyrophagus putrescentiae]|nr:hypothetical protein [Wolbachia endosymbiont of Tyrophagus putrescentiae]
MVNQEKPQDFELIELLIKEVQRFAEQAKDEFKSFNSRFQSYVDQISSRQHSISKDGFFTHFFLGGFSTLLNTAIKDKLKVKKVYFRFDSAKILKVAVVTSESIKSREEFTKNVHLFSISESSSAGKFTDSDLENVLSACTKRLGIPKNVRKNLEFRSVRIDKGQVETTTKKIDDNSQSSTTTKSEFHKISNNNKDLDGHVNNLHTGSVEGVKFQFKSVMNGIKEIYDSNQTHFKYGQEKGKKYKEAGHHGFIAGALVNFRYRYNLRAYLEQYAGRGFADIILLPRGKDRSLKSIPIIIELKAGKKNSSDNKNSPEKALEQAKRYAKGFQPNTTRVLTIAENIICAGVNLDYSQKSFIEFKECPINKNIEPLFNDILESLSKQISNDAANDEKKIREKIERIFHTFPSPAFSDSDGQDGKGGKRYFSRFLLGESFLVENVGGASFRKYIFDPEYAINDAHYKYFSEVCKVISQFNKKPSNLRVNIQDIKNVVDAIQKFVDYVALNNKQFAKVENNVVKLQKTVKTFAKQYEDESSDEEKEKIKDKLKKELSGLEKNIKVIEDCNYPEYAVVTVVFKPDDENKPAYVVNIIEAESRENILKKAIPLGDLKLDNKKVVELNLHLDVTKRTKWKDLKFEEFFEVQVTCYESQEKYKEGSEYSGECKEMRDTDEIEKMFKEALSSQVNNSLKDKLAQAYEEARNKLTQAYKELVNKIGEAIKPSPRLIEKEAHTQALLHGVSSCISDKMLASTSTSTSKEKERALVISEFQTGLVEKKDKDNSKRKEGGIIDMLIHGIKCENGNAKEYIPVGLEIKGPRGGISLEALQKEAINSMKSYKSGVAYKSLTDGDKVVLMGVVCHKDEKNHQLSIDMVQDEVGTALEEVEVKHSSIMSIKR